VRLYGHCEFAILEVIVGVDLHDSGLRDVIEGGVGDNGEVSMMMIMMIIINSNSPHPICSGQFHPCTKNC
jgi:hypothetical protein